MRRLLLSLASLVLVPVAAGAQDMKTIVEAHVLPGYETLAQESAELASVAATGCSPDNSELVSAYHDAFDAWVRVSHLRFGPSETDDRAFALAFWPDPRGSTPKALSTLIRDSDPVVDSAEGFATVSIAARGFYALEFLLFDPQFTEPEAPDYTCALIRAVTRDIAGNAADILMGWQSGYADLMITPGNATYKTSAEAARQVFTALTTGLEFTSQTRLGRPMGTFERPRPQQAEARRSGRSLRHVILSLEATGQLAALMSSGDGDVTASFDAALMQAQTLDDPVFAAVADPQGRFRVEVLQQKVDAIRTLLSDRVGPALGIAAGFNSLDGD